MNPIEWHGILLTTKKFTPNLSFCKFLIENYKIQREMGNTHHSHAVIAILQSCISHYLLPGLCYTCNFASFDIILVFTLLVPKCYAFHHIMSFDITYATGVLVLNQLPNILACIIATRAVYLSTTQTCAHLFQG